MIVYLGGEIGAGNPEESHSVSFPFLCVILFSCEGHIHGERVGHSKKKIASLFLDHFRRVLLAACAFSNSDYLLYKFQEQSESPCAGRL